MPGRPTEFEASLYSIPGHPLRHMALAVNGAGALSATHDVHKANLKGKSAHFKFGWNVLTLSASKGKGACRADVAAVGVALELHLKFGADLVAKSPEPANNNSALLFDEVTITNKGPSSTLRDDQLLGRDQPCEARRRQVRHHRRGPAERADRRRLQVLLEQHVLPHAGLDPGESFHVYAHYIYNAPPAPTPFYEEFVTQWGVSADTIDPMPANNGAKHTRGVCRQSAPPPCKKP